MESHRPDTGSKVSGTVTNYAVYASMAKVLTGGVGRILVDRVIVHEWELGEARVGHHCVEFNPGPSAFDLHGACRNVEVELIAGNGNPVFTHHLGYTLDSTVYAFDDGKMPITIGDVPKFRY